MMMMQAQQQNVRWDGGVGDIWGCRALLTLRAEAGGKRVWEWTRCFLTLINNDEGPNQSETSAVVVMHVLMVEVRENKLLQSGAGLWRRHVKMGQSDTAIS
jgi:hypothetical protein